MVEKKENNIQGWRYGERCLESVRDVRDWLLAEIYLPLKDLTCHGAVVASADDFESWMVTRGFITESFPEAGLFWMRYDKSNPKEPVKDVLRDKDLEKMWERMQTDLALAEATALRKSIDKKESKPAPKRSI